MASYAQSFSNHPSFALDVPVAQSSLVRQGVPSVSATSTPNIEYEYQYFITDVSILQAFHVDYVGLNYNVLY